MDVIEKRARELLASHLPKGLGFWRAPLLDPQYPADYFPDSYQAAINAISCSITPPEGYVLVPVVPTTQMMDAAVPTSSQDQTGRRQRALWDAMLAARPEVP